MFLGIPDGAGHSRAVLLHFDAIPQPINLLPNLHQKRTYYFAIHVVNLNCSKIDLNNLRFYLLVLPLNVHVTILLDCTTRFLFVSVVITALLVTLLSVISLAFGLRLN